MKRIIVSAAVLLSFVTVCMTAAASPATKSFSWYFKPATDGKQPEVMGGSHVVTDENLLYIGNETEKKIYLTFDAGYASENVEKTLDILKRQSVKAAFFILPAVPRYAPAIAERMATEGHLVCNHTYSHCDVSAITDKATLENELKKAEAAYRDVTGCEMAKYFRPPEGKFSELSLKYCGELGYKSVFWSFAYADWDNNKQKDPTWAKEKILSNVHNGMVMLLHPNSATNAAVLEDVIIQLKNDGYTFGTLDELAKEKAALNVENQKVIDVYKEKGWLYSDNRTAGKKVALTFDDGPHSTFTPQILDILKKYEVKATFFVIGENVMSNKTLIEDIIKDGHEIGNHTYSHANVTKLTTDEFIGELEKTEAVLKDNFGYKPTLLRPPGGAVSSKRIDEAHEAGYKYILWTWKINTLDWSCPSPEYVESAIMDNVSGGDIILLHDYVVGNSPTPAALERVIPALKAKGYEFVTVSELIGVT